jgi:hypothetical protein
MHAAGQELQCTAYYPPICSNWTYRPTPGAYDPLLRKSVARPFHLRHNRKMKPHEWSLFLSLFLYGKISSRQLPIAMRSLFLLSPPNCRLHDIKSVCRALA